MDEDDNAWVYFGTGRYISEDDKTNSDQQYLFGLKDPFFNRERPVYYENGSSSLELTTALLINSDDYKVLDTGKVYDPYSSSTDPYYSDFDSFAEIFDTVDGWSRTLDTFMERVITKPAIVGGTLLTTSFIPTSDICGYGGGSNLYAMYYKTGTAYEVAAFEPGGTTQITVDGEVMTVISERMNLGDGLASAPGIHIGQQDDDQVTAYIQTSKGDIKVQLIIPADIPRSTLETWREVQ